ncbi:ell-associated factor Eaf [Bactrocera dorsalis]|uniref:Ell-associated factor Eaf n=1 Tax=Bactrocera dorsalis TaxID=27457 RepID=A0A8N4QEL6_BACDO|nr:ell-associated factor Eaf [Bactrocera dorsalis]XP_029405383.2 ell-associated factor Eaf [Bactrocera dorsalis]
MMMTKHKSSLAERLNIGDEVRDLKLGCTYNPKNTTTAFHTIKYDFKPASVDKSKVALVDVGSNNQVTVTVPNLVSSGVPHTVYKGNHRKYTKECLLIYDRKTGGITFEKLNHNIQVKKTRSEMTNKPSAIAASANVAPQQKLENSTMRITSKTKVSTGSRRNNIIDFKPRNSPSASASPSAPPSIHKSPQSAPAWNANNTQATLPSIPMIFDDDDDGMFGLTAAATGNSQTHGGSGSDAANMSSSSSASSHNNSAHDYHMQMQQQQQQQQPAPTKQSKQSHRNNQKRQNNLNAATATSATNAVPIAQSHCKQTKHNRIEQRTSSPQTFAQQQQQQQRQQQHNLYQQPQQQSNNNRMYPTNSSSSMQMSNGVTGGYHNSNNMSMGNQMLHHHQTQQQHNMPGMSSPHDSDAAMASAAAQLEQQIRGLSSSSSSSSSDSSGSDCASDSDDSSDEEDQQQQQQAQHQMHQLPNLMSALPPMSTTAPQYNRNTPSSGYASNNSHTNNNGAFTSDLLQNDLQLSSNSSDEDD